MEDLSALSEAMSQASSIIAEGGGAEPPGGQGLIHVVALGPPGAGKSAVLNSLIGHPVLPVAEGGATKCPVVVELTKGQGHGAVVGQLLSAPKQKLYSAEEIRKALGSSMRRWLPSLSKSTEGLELTLETGYAVAPGMRVVDLPGVSEKAKEVDTSTYSAYTSAQSIFLLVVPATSARDVALLRALQLVRQVDNDKERTIGVLTKIDQAVGDNRALAAVWDLLNGNGPSSISGIPWVAVVGQPQSDGSGSGETLESQWKAENAVLTRILSRDGMLRLAFPLGREGLLRTLRGQVKAVLRARIPALVAGLQGKSDVVKEELVRLGAQRIESSEGHRAHGLSLCREFDERLQERLATGEAGARMVTSFEVMLPKRMRQLPLDDIFALANIKQVVLEADGYHPHLFSPEKGIRSLVARAMELAKAPALLCVDEIHRILVDVVSATANATPGLSRYTGLKTEVVGVVSTALESTRSGAQKTVTSLVEMERAFIQPAHFRRFTAKRLHRMQAVEEKPAGFTQRVRGMFSKDKPATAPAAAAAAAATGPSIAPGASVRPQQQPQPPLQASASFDKKAREAAPSQSGFVGEGSLAGYLNKRSSKSASWSKRWFSLNTKTGKLSYAKKPEDKLYRGIIQLKDCVVEENVDSLDETDETGSVSGSSTPASRSDSGLQLKQSGSGLGRFSSGGTNLAFAFRIKHKRSYGSVVKAHRSIVLRAENLAEKAQWVLKLTAATESGGAVAAAGGAAAGSAPPSAPTSPRGGPTPAGSSGEVDEEGAEVQPQLKPLDPDEELKLLGQEVREYVERVLSGLVDNIPKAIVYLQVEGCRGGPTLNTLYSTMSTHSKEKLEELLQEDPEVRDRREKASRQASMLARLTRQLSLQSGAAPPEELEPAAATAEPLGAEDWRLAFQEAGNDFDSGRAPSPMSVLQGPSTPYRGLGGVEDGALENGSLTPSRRVNPARAPPAPPGTTNGPPSYRY